MILAKPHRETKNEYTFAIQSRCIDVFANKTLQEILERPEIPEPPRDLPETSEKLPRDVPEPFPESSQMIPGDTSQMMPDDLR